MNTSEAIKTARLAAGLSVAELAAKLGVAENTVYRWESPESWGQTPRVAMIRRIVAVTGQAVRVDY